MRRFKKGAIALCLTATMGVEALAQEATPLFPGPSDPKSQSAPTNDLEGHMRSIDLTMQKFGQLSEVLGQASKDLSTDFDRYLADPKNEVLASGLEKKMAIFADQVVQEFDYVLADQDVIIAGFKELKLKLDTYDDTIAERLDAYDKKLEGFREMVKEQEQTLIGLSIKIKESANEADKKKAMNEFAREYRRFRLKNRHVRGLERNLHNYQVLVQNLQLLSNVFGQLQDKFVALIEHLDMEKDYLVEAIELQAESVKIKKIMSEGIMHGERSIKNVTERLALLYARVDAFTEVHDKLNMGLGGFLETQETLKDLSSKIDLIGEGVTTGAGEPETITDAVDRYYQKRGEFRPNR